MNQSIVCVHGCGTDAPPHKDFTLTFTCPGETSLPWHMLPDGPHIVAVPMFENSRSERWTLSRYGESIQPASIRHNIRSQAIPPTAGVNHNVVNAEKEETIDRSGQDAMG